ncbi:FkbM family methyltransferase [Alteromonas sp. RKMC-009]|uniref:FkbM family methyltransferase n=1 Tax=Alteromonas sp. RKMC-009 TaxID=2267264 RepID=UPI000E686A96|nr:FkbM family methyltransferase [Alteromonas sp. RKMC-009]AYA63680.1 FkbM family methyltransferase [Alteromonas sp. RKMC-009]
MSNFFADLFTLLQQNKALHQRDGEFHRVMSSACERVFSVSQFSEHPRETVVLGPFGEIALPYYSMGNINSLDLFGLDELILFSFYLAKKEQYKSVADMGANIGLHSLLMDKNGWQVTAFEPDPNHTAKIKYHAELNVCEHITVKEYAISDQKESLTFTRLIGNRTGSHLKGKKEHVYGSTEEFTVACLALKDVLAQFDFIKMDIEGAEADALCSTDKADWANTDMMLEVGSASNAQRIWQHLQTIGLQAYSQKNGWGLVECLEHMPTSYKEGSLFLTMSGNAPF